MLKTATKHKRPEIAIRLLLITISFGDILKFNLLSRNNINVGIICKYELKEFFF